MRYHTLPALEKHLAQTPFNPHGNCFGIQAEDDLERRFIRDKIASYFIKQFPRVAAQEIDLAQANIQHVLQEIDSTDLFATEKLYVLKSPEKLTKEALELLIKKLSEAQCLGVIVEGHDVKVETKLYEKLKKQMVVLDVSKEKPWDRKARLFSWLESIATHHKKMVHKDALEMLYEKCKKQFSWMYQELEKLLCFAKDASSISAHDVQKLCGLDPEVNTYVLCEKIVFGGQEGIRQALNYPMQPQELFALLGQLRFQLHTGIKLQEYLKRKIPYEEFEGSFSYAIQKNLPRYIKVCQQLPDSYFYDCLVLILDYECKAKSHSLDYQALFTSLVMHLEQLQHNG